MCIYIYIYTDTHLYLSLYIRINVSGFFGAIGFDDLLPHWTKAKAEATKKPRAIKAATAASTPAATSVRSSTSLSVDLSLFVAGNPWVLRCFKIVLRLRKVKPNKTIRQKAILGTAQFQY